jgi:hypothetical protein
MVTFDYFGPHLDLVQVPFLIITPLNKLLLWKLKITSSNLQTCHFNNIPFTSWWSVLLMEETRVPRENPGPAASHWQTLSHNVESNIPFHEWDSNTQLYFNGDKHWLHNYKSNYHRVTTTTVSTTLCFMRKVKKEKQNIQIYTWTWA